MNNKYKTSELIEYLDNIQYAAEQDFGFEDDRPLFEEIKRRLYELDKIKETGGSI